MAEAIGIAAGAITFAKATAVVLDAINKIKDAPKNIQELQYELRDLEAVLGQIGNGFPCQGGGPTEAALRSCSDALKQLHDLVAPLRQEVEDNKFKQYVKGLRMRPKESKIEGVVKRLQSRKFTLVLALIASNSRSGPLSYPARSERIDVATGGPTKHLLPQLSLISDMRCCARTAKIWIVSLVKLK